VDHDQRLKVQPLRSRIHDYYRELRRRHGLPVLPIGLYLRVGLDGIGTDVYEERFWERTFLHFEYFYVGLPGLRAEQYLTGENLLGVALSALMAIDQERRAWLTAEAMRRLVDSGLSDQRRYLLCECVQAYAPMDEQRWQEYQQLLMTEPYRRVQPVTMTYLEQRDVKVREQTLRLAVRTLLESRFGQVGRATLAHLETLSEERLLALIRDLKPEIQSIQDLGLPT
jgi:hypothetical protein